MRQHLKIISRDQDDDSQVTCAVKWTAFSCDRRGGILDPDVRRDNTYYCDKRERSVMNYDGRVEFCRKSSAIL